MTEFKVGDKVKRNKKAIDGGNICCHCVVDEVAQICKVLEVRSEKVYVECPDGHKEDMSFGSYELVKSHKPKDPTHLVIWDEDRDPYKFFTDEPEAKKFIKELSDKPDVKKESIILVTIKSAQKVSITKNVRLMSYKI